MNKEAAVDWSGQRQSELSFKKEMQELREQTIERELAHQDRSKMAQSILSGDLQVFYLDGRALFGIGPLEIGRLPGDETILGFPIYKGRELSARIYKAKVEALQ